MPTTPSELPPPADPSLPAAGRMDALAERALAVQRAARAGRLDRVLRGKNFGLVSEVQAGHDAELFHRAATELGAKVARILPSIAGLLDAAEAQTTGLWLGRLYDAVECQGLPAERVAEIRAAAGIPILDSLQALREADAALAAVRDSLASDDDRRRWVLQAMLIRDFA